MISSSELLCPWERLQKCSFWWSEWEFSRWGLFSPLKGTSSTWDFYFHVAFIQVPLQPKQSRAHTLSVIISVSWKQWNRFDCPAHEEQVPFRWIKEKLFPGRLDGRKKKSCCTTKDYFIESTINFYCKIIMLNSLVVEKITYLKTGCSKKTCKEFKVSSIWVQTIVILTCLIMWMNGKGAVVIRPVKAVNSVSCLWSQFHSLMLPEQDLKQKHALSAICPRGLSDMTGML